MANTCKRGRKQDLGLLVAGLVEAEEAPAAAEEPAASGAPGAEEETAVEEASVVAEDSAAEKLL